MSVGARHLVGLALAVVASAAMGACSEGAVRIVDCAPGYHNVAGPESDCVPNVTTPGGAPQSST